MGDLIVLAKLETHPQSGASKVAQLEGSPHLHAFSSTVKHHAQNTTTNMQWAHRCPSKLNHPVTLQALQSRSCHHVNRAIISALVKERRLQKDFDLGDCRYLCRR